MQALIANITTCHGRKKNINRNHFSKFYIAIVRLRHIRSSKGTDHILRYIFVSQKHKILKL
jgi:hypothetical protein